MDMHDDHVVELLAAGGDALAAPLAIIDVWQRSFVWVNAAFARMAGGPQEGFAGPTMGEFVPQDEVAAERSAAIDALLEEGRAVMQWQQPDANGTLRW